MKKHMKVCIVIAVAFVLFGCSKPKPTDPAPAPITAQVYYTVTLANGTTEPTDVLTTSITYTQADGNSFKAYATLPYTSTTMTFTEGSTASITANHMLGASMTANIYKNGVLIKTITGSSSVTVSGSI
jgi:hypothetical protein